MGHVQRRADASGRLRWQARYRAPDGRERTRRFDTKTEAEAWLVAEQSSRQQGAWVDPRAGKILLKNFSVRYVAALRRQPATMANIEGRLRTRILPAFGDWPLVAIQPGDVQSWVSQISDEIAPPTVRSYYFTLAKLLRTAQVQRLIAVSPCVGIDLPSEQTTHEMRFLEAHEVSTLADAIDGRFRALVFTAAYTGLRFGELAGLRVRRVNLLRRQLEVREAVSEVSGRLYVKPTKTYAARTLTLPAFLAQLLGEHIGLHPGKDGFVFPAPEGGPLRRRNFYRRYYEPAVAAARLTPLRFHDLRHTHAALLIAQGAHPKEIQERMGHSTIRVTFDRYGHLLPGLEGRLVDGLEESFRKASAAQRS